MTAFKGTIRLLETIPHIVMTMDHLDDFRLLQGTLGIMTILLLLRGTTVGQCHLQGTIETIHRLPRLAAVGTTMTIDVLLLYMIVIDILPLPLLTIVAADILLRLTVTVAMLLLQRPTLMIDMREDLWIAM